MNYDAKMTLTAGFALFFLASAAAVNAPAASAKVRAGVVDSTDVTLPSGSSTVYRQRMIEWEKPSEASPLRLRERPDAPAAAQLDRLAISSPFGWRSDPMNRIKRHHEGIDLPARFGSAVMATGSGIVRIAAWVRGYGNLVEIEHANGVRTRYGHLARVGVYPSEHVEQGQTIGKVGSTGRSTGPHLHYEVRVNGTAVDPLSFLDRGASSYDAVWEPILRATPKWDGWNGMRADSLPEARIH